VRRNKEKIPPLILDLIHRYGEGMGASGEEIYDKIIGIVDFLD
jgi:hypothetical protein